MPIYRIKLHGVEKPLLVRAESAAKAKDQIIDLSALTSEEMADALAAGDKIYVPGDSVLPPEPEAKPETSGKDEAGDPPVNNAAANGKQTKGADAE